MNLQRYEYTLDGMDSNDDGNYVWHGDYVFLEQRLRDADSYCAELERHLRRVIGDHCAPADCYATGPLTGDDYKDLVECPSCAALAKLDAGGVRGDHLR